ncbi:MAG: CinA family nicotinamide mononucleotide deamidase-related protein [Desulfuromonadales bacterium]|nr:CinA family nicotinamide mononucleotide deamidase-related protein [Desulfuromonadales bacterium]
MQTFSPKIAVLTIGDELLNGEISDTNTRRIALALATRGLFIREVMSVGDDEDYISEALQELSGRRQVVIVTGGLGPTHDDMTTRAAAKAFRRPLVLNDEALQQIHAHFRRTGREMHGGNEKQALFPQKATLIPNLVGSAPGFRLQIDHCILYFLPGVPAEMEPMLEAYVLPQLQAALPPSIFVERIFTLIGVAEPQVENLLAAAGLPRGVMVGFGVTFPLVYLKLRACGAEAEDLLDRSEPVVLRTVGDYLVARSKETLASVVAKLLLRSGETLSLAESCTGGMIAAQLTDIPGASAFLERGAVTYADKAKVGWLKVPAWMIEQEGAVSATTAKLMARGIRRVAATDFGLAVTGVAGPGGGTTEKPVGTVYMALATAAGERVLCHHFGGNRDEIRRLSAAHALDLLRRQLLGLFEDNDGGESSSFAP